MTDLVGVEPDDYDGYEPGDEPADPHALIAVFAAAFPDRPEADLHRFMYDEDWRCRRDYQAIVNRLRGRALTMHKEMHHA